MTICEVYFYDIICNICRRQETCKTTQRNPDMTAWKGRWVKVTTSAFERHSDSRKEKHLCVTCFSKFPVKEVHNDRIVISYKPLYPPDEDD